MKSPKIKILVAAHKPYQMPDDEIYLPIQVGAALSDQDFGFQKDDEGENISAKNKNYCELTALYWAWKNLDADYVGLAHYRRHFAAEKSGKDKFDHVLTGAQAKELLQGHYIILPKVRNYYIENLYGHYAHTMHVEPLDITGEIIAEKYPAYSVEFKKLHTRKKAHMFNMFVMKKDIFNDYCAWLFDILAELERRVEASKYDVFHARFYGRISELLLDVYIRTNKLNYIEIPVIDIEDVNWLKKGSSFLAAKFFGRKYEKSF